MYALFIDLIFSFVYEFMYLYTYMVLNLYLLISHVCLFVSTSKHILCLVFTLGIFTVEMKSLKLLSQHRDSLANID